jgi:carboxypeptidase family protein
MRSPLPAHKIVTSRKRNLLAAVVVSIVTLGNAQTPSQVAMVSGTVTDVTGAQVPGAIIRLTHPGDPSLQTTTDVNGHFEMTAKPGEYVLETNAQGFMMDKLPVQLSAATQSTEHIALRVAMGGGVGISIEQPRIETLDASLTATLPLTSIPPYKQTSRKPHPLSK